MDDKLKELIVRLSVKVFNKYSYVFFNEEEKSEIIKIVISKNLTNQREIQQYLDITIKNFIAHKLPDIEIINNYLSKKVFSKTEKDAMSYINMFVRFCEQFNMDMNEDFLVELLQNNEMLLYSVCIYFNKNKDFIQNGHIHNITKSDVKILLLKAYGLFEGIVIIESDNETLSMKNDSLRAYYDEISKYPILKPEEEVEFFKLYQAGDLNARQTIINSNLRFVVSIAKKYIYTGMPILDIIQEGNIGLIKAIDHFDITKGYRFLTYAAYWIKQQIQHSINKTLRTIRIPAHKIEQIAAYKKKKEEFEIQFNRSLTNEELAVLLNVSVDTILEFERLILTPVSLNYMVESETEFQDFVSSDEESVEEQIIHKESKEILNKLFKLARLSERDIEIIKYLYGVDGRTPLTYREIAKKFEISSSRVDQIVRRSINKLVKFKSEYDEPNKESTEYHVVYKRQLTYERFKNYSKEDIDYAAYFLPSDEKRIFELYNNPNERLDYIQTNKYYQLVLPHLRRLIKTLNIKPGGRCKNGE